MAVDRKATKEKGLCKDGRRRFKSKKRDTAYFVEKMQSTKGLEPDQVKNGWTAPEWAKYVAEREQAFKDGPTRSVEDLYRSSDNFDPYGW